MQRILTLAASGILAAAASPAWSGEALFGVYAHDLSDRFSLGGFEKGPQVVAGVRTASLDELSLIFKPRVHLIAGVNTRGGTNYAAAGLSWRIHFANERFYIQPGIGAANHTGRVDLPSPDEPGLSSAEQQRRLRDWQTKLDLGSRVLFEPEWTLGWKANERFSVEVSWIHLSHAQLAGKQNPGLGDFGLRAVYRYGIDR